MREGMLNGIDVNQAFELSAITRFKNSGWIGKSVLHPNEWLNANIHLEHGKAARQPALELKSHRLTGRFVRRVAIHADGIAEFATCENISRNAVSLARQIHQRHFDTAHTSALPRVMAKLLNLAKDFIYIAGILAKQTALEHQRVRLARAIAYFTVAAQTLIGVNADERETPSLP